ncbi:methionyl-tRNA formyltransferase [Candidatus Kaiserbacteria bacterium]|nr:methionyl-tRNA formyltransferase [Candidatus Kaiserbacteria bacterium]
MNKKDPSDIRFVFFGTGEIARYALEEIRAAGFVPQLIVTEPDAKRGRGLKTSSSPVKAWAASQDIETLQPEALRPDVLEKVRALEPDLAVVVDYGTFLPKVLLETPRRGCLNMHPSLLPRLRGPSPIRSAILNDERTTGVSVILLDEEVDHGPLVAQKPLSIAQWPPRGKALDEALAREGGKLLAFVIPQWIAGEIEARAQNHDVATYSTKFTKEDGLLDLSGDAYQNLLKIRAFEGWPGTYTFFGRGGKKLRVQILDARMSDKKLIIDTVKPEGKREMGYEEFLRSGAQPL